MSKELTIVIAAYNVEKYITKLLDVLLPQIKNRNIEVIIVNDGSTDSTEECINNFNSENLKVVNQSNTGLSEVRNLGISLADSEYITFLDGDDFITSNYIEVVENSLEGRPDIVSFPFYYYWNEKNKKISDDADINKFNKNNIKEKALNYAYMHKESDAVVWNKIYKTSIIKDGEIRFQTKKFFEDVLFNLSFINRIKSAKYIDIPLVYYVQREGSITSSYDEEVFASFKKVTSLLEKMLKSEESNGKEIVEVMKLRMSLYILNYLRKYDASKKNYKIHFEKIISNSESLKQVNIKKLNFKHGLFVFLIKNYNRFKIKSKK
ncbi:glycosyltransferase family 2 protein [Exiguobacterium mexicanum]|uniref:glycosyltransferase family 2 protein n=1 Tax=Exiguobacterium mexicanum TaxID=340146 RepID=UPI00384AF55C